MFEVGDIIEWYVPNEKKWYVPDGKCYVPKQFEVVGINPSGSFRVRSLCEEDRILQVQRVLDKEQERLWINDAVPEYFRLVKKHDEI